MEQPCYISNRIFLVLNLGLFISTIWTNKQICTILIWLAIYGIFLLCLAINTKKDLPIWIPGFSQNPYLNMILSNPGIEKCNSNILQ